MIDVALQIATASTAVPAESRFRAWIETTLAGRREAAEIAVRIVDEPEGRELNTAWRGRDYATNVLAFPAELPAGVDLPVLGDLVVCAPVVAREAAEQGKPVEAHWAHMVVHGVLHLLGHDHIEETEAEAMERLEREILAKLDYPDPYAGEMVTG